MFTRRDLGRIALGAFAAERLLGKPNSTIRGVTVGIHSRSFRDRPLDKALAAMVQVGIASCELWEGHVAPPRLSRGGLREWRENIAIEQFQVVASEFAQAGVKIFAYNYELSEDSSEREIQRGFEMTKALGTTLITMTPPMKLIPTLAAAALKAGMFVGIRNGDRTEAGVASSPADLSAVATANAGAGICLDLGDFTAAGYDPLKALTGNAFRLFAVYLRDRRGDHGPSLVYGQGNTPLAAVLKQIQGSKLKIEPVIDYDYAAPDPVIEVERCFAFCRQVLMARFPAEPAAAAEPAIAP